MSISNVVPRTIGALICLMLLTAVAAAADYSPDPLLDSEPPSLAPFDKGTDAHSYLGYFRIYVVQDSSTHYLDYAGRPYHFAFAGFAVNEFVTISYIDTLEYDIVWSGSAHPPYSDIQEDNIRVIAVVTNDEGHVAYSYPGEPNPHPFQAFYPQRVAVALPGQTSTDQASGEFSHTILCEVGTGSWCQYCPATANGMWALYEGGDYPFYYIDMVDSYAPANTWIHSGYFNIAAYPTGWMNGGYNLHVGGSPDTVMWGGLVRDAGHLSVDDVFMEVSLEWLGNAQLHITARLAKSGLTNAAPNNADAPTGATEVWSTLEEQYVVSAVEPEGDQVYYMWAFGDGDTSDWMGPYDSGDTCMLGHTWSAAGTYDVTVAVKDVFDEPAPGWSDPLVVTATDIICGDADGNTIINIADAVALIGYIFGGASEPDPYLSGDADCNLILNIADAVYLISYIFGGGAAPCAHCD